MHSFVKINRVRKSIAYLLFIFISTSSFAQKQSAIWGILKDSITKEPIALAAITNLDNKNTVMSSNTGRFKIEVAEYNILSFAAVGYFFDTTIYHGNILKNDTLYLYLSPLAHSLGNVTVYSKGISHYQMDSIERREEFLQDIVNYTIPTVAAANYGAGIALNLDRFSKHEKSKRKAFRFFETNEKEAYINYRFPPEIVVKYTGFKDEDLQLFMQQNRPTYEWLRKHPTEEDIKYYINDQLKRTKR